MAKSKEELKSLLMKVKEENEKACLKLKSQETKIMALQSHHFMGNRLGNNGNSERLLLSWAPKWLQMVTAAMKLKDTCSLEGKLLTNLDSILKNRDITLPTKVRIVKAMVFPVVIYRWELDHKEGRVPKIWCFWTVVLRLLRALRQQGEPTSQS